MVKAVVKTETAKTKALPELKIELNAVFNFVLTLSPALPKFENDADNC